MRIKKVGLGETFIQAIQDKIEAILKNPSYYGSKSSISFREAIVNRFPYIIVYKIYEEKGVVFISSVHHAKKHPAKKIRE